MWGVRKSSLEQPALRRRGQKPELEALPNQSPWRKASHPVGRHIKMPDLNASAKDASATGFVETNNAQLGTCFLMCSKHNITLAFIFLIYTYFNV